MVGHADILKTGGSLLFCGNLSTISRDSQSHTSELDGGGEVEASERRPLPLKESLGERVWGK